MNLAAGQMCTRKARADLHALNRLNGHERPRELSVETTIPLRMGAKPDRKPAHNDLKDAAKRIAIRLCLVDVCLHACLCRRITAVQVAAVRHTDVLIADCHTVNRHATDLSHMRGDGHTDGSEQLTADSTDSNTHRRLARTRTFEDVTCVIAVVFQYAREIGMPRTDGSNLRPRRISEGIHALRPVCKVAVHDLKCDRRAECLTEAHPRENFDPICFDLHAVAAPISLLTARKLRINGLAREPQSGGHTVEDRRERRTV